MKKLFCVLIPAHNEEVVIESTLKSLQRTSVPDADVYVVDDASTDKTAKLVQEKFPNINIKSFRKNHGKARALEAGLRLFNLEQQYEWIQFMDADTQLLEEHVAVLTKTLSTLSPTIVAVCPEVKTDRLSWNPFTLFRTIEYFITHKIYKAAQHVVNCVTVLPGCGSLIRSNIFLSLLNEVERSEVSMLTEDMDWTIAIHHLNKGKIIYTPDVVVHTQDPRNFRDYLKQIHRWYRGFWQIYRMRNMWNITKKINFETSLLAIEGVFFGVCWLTGIYLTITHGAFNISNKFLMLDLALFTLYVAITSIYLKTFRLLAYTPVFYPLRMLNCFVYLYSMVEILILQADKWAKLGWNKVNRYAPHVKN